MEAGYKRSRGSSYLLLSENPQKAALHYQKTIFLENTIPGLLSCKVQRLDGEESFHYDITGCQSLKNLFSKEKLSRKDLEEIFQSWIKVCEILDEYLLDTDFLLLDPSYLYRNTQTGNYFFIWFPFHLQEQEAGKELLSLSEYFLPRIDHKDKSAIALGYGVYKDAVAGNIRPDIIKALLYDPKPPEEKADGFQEKESLQFSAEECQEMEAQKKARQKILDDFYKEEEEEDSSGYGIIVGIGISLFCILVFLIWHFRLLSPLQLLILSGCLLLLAGLGILIWYLRSRKKTPSVPSPQKSSFQEQDAGQVCSENASGKEESEISTFCSFLSSEGEKDLQKVQPAESLTVLLDENPSLCPVLAGLGKNSDKVFPLERDTTIIGKWAASADICLDIPTVSRIHAKIIREGENCYIIDLNSKNGTWVNGVPLNPEEKTTLKRNDIICFAREEFRYTAPDLPHSDNAAEN